MAPAISPNLIRDREASAILTVKAPTILYSTPDFEIYSRAAKSLELRKICHAGMHENR